MAFLTIMPRLSRHSRLLLVGLCSLSFCWVFIIYLYLGLKSDSSVSDNALGYVGSESERAYRREGYEQHSFNVLVSDRLGPRRPLPDTRHALCRNRTYSEQRLPTASVVICFHNEAASTLLRSVVSVLDSCPSALLKEVVLVDDSSDVHLTRQIGDVLDQLASDKVRLLRPGKRLGLIRARIYGADHTTGDTLVFLDSHIEANRDWLQPLLETVGADRRHVAIPIVDVINPDTFVYTPSPLVKGGFNWVLHFKWESVPKERFAAPSDYVRPIETPTMSGGLFAMSRSYFYELGTYDDGMDVWGAENIELSFRVWMCGGRLKIIPCSRIGHVFRKRRPYDTPAGMFSSVQNALRVVHVWLDDYKKYFFETNPAAESMAYGDVSDRIRLRERLNCSTFQWYVDHVYPSLALPSITGRQPGGILMPDMARGSLDRAGLVASPRPRRYLSEFRLRLHGTNYCVEPRDGLSLLGSRLWLELCTASSVQVFHETRRQELLLERMFCLDAGRKQPSLQKCHQQLGEQQWNYNSRVSTAIYCLAAGLCLAAEDTQPQAAVVMDVCEERENVVWDLLHVNITGTGQN